MPHTPTYCAAACTGCRRAALLVQTTSDRLACPRCGEDCLAVPGAEYAPSDVRLFSELEQVVDAAQLSSRGAAIIAAELETVGLRWEPPELALERVARRLPGLRRLYSSREDYGQLLLTVSMLLTIVCARLQAPAEPRGALHRQSGVHATFREDPSGAQSDDLKKSG